MVNPVTEYMHLNAARAFATRVPFLEVRRQRSVQMDDESVEAPASDDVDFWTHPLAMMESFQGSPNRVATDARDFRELESLVRALDTMETLASLAELSRE
jgi:nuclear pore complex protein Nup107